VSGFEGGQHGGGSFGFQSDHFCVGRIHFKVGACSRCKAAAADGDEEEVERLCVFWEVFEDLHCYCALSFDDLQVVEGRDKGHALFFGVLAGCDGAIIVGVADEDDLYAIFPEHLCLVDLLFGGDDGHENDAFSAQFTAGVGESLCVVAGAGADDAFLQLFCRQADHHIIGASQFIGADDLQVFAFEEHLAIIFPGQAVIIGERGTVYDFTQPLGG